MIYVLAITALSISIIAALASIAGVVYISAQSKQVALHRQVSAYAEIFSLVMDTSWNRMYIYQNKEEIVRIGSEEELQYFIKRRPEIHNSILIVANCYQYAGFLASKNVLDLDDFLDEASNALIRIDEIIAAYIDLLQKQSNPQDYKQYY
ncbi:MAG: hypothetical protein FWC81_01165 [Coriobacteriia bacterium]|nr:hypothetical protein [Coriobacteriia bacterium]